MTARRPVLGSGEGRRSRRLSPVGDEGMAMLAALWITALLSVLGLGLVVEARAALGSAGNRIELIRLAWRVEACIASARAGLDRTLALSRREDDESNDVWSQLDAVLRFEDEAAAGCQVSLRRTGIRVDANALDSAGLANLLRVERVPRPRADSMVAAFLDARDGDDAPRGRGAEQAWYRSRRRPPPPDGPFEHSGEIRLVRGFEDEPRIIGYLGVEPEPLSPSHAPEAVLSTLPGFDPMVAAVAVDLRERDPDWGPEDLLGLLPQVSAVRLRAALPALRSLVTNEPGAWWLAVRASEGTPPLEVAFELRLVRNGERAVVTRRRGVTP